MHINCDMMIVSFSGVAVENMPVVVAAAVVNTLGSWLQKSSVSKNRENKEEKINSEGEAAN